MLVVVLKSKNVMSGAANHIEVHVPFSTLPKLENEEIDFIQADCDELDTIRYSFTNGGITEPTIPWPSNKRVIRWYGDIAKTIYFNLR